MVKAEPKNKWVEMSGGEHSRELFDISEDFVVEQLFRKNGKQIVIKKEKSSEKFIVDTDMNIEDQKYKENIKAKACEKAEELMTD